MQSQEDDLLVGRRGFIGGISHLIAGAVGGAALGAAPVFQLEAKASEISPLSVIHRRNAVFSVLSTNAHIQKQLGIPAHATNGDEELYLNKIGNFSKTLPHNAYGEVDLGAYSAFLQAIAAGSFAAFEAVPAGGSKSMPFANPLGGQAFNLEGPDSRAIKVFSPPPTFDSVELAAQMVELYWMALLRDVPFAEFYGHPLVAAAVADLNAQPGYQGPVDPLTGTVTPQVLFRNNFPGVIDGPIVSQFLLNKFDYDAIPVDPKIRTAVPGIDFLTSYSEWLAAQRGFPNGAPSGKGPRDAVLRYPRSERDLGHFVGNDLIYSACFRAANILLALAGSIDVLDAGNPYNGSKRQAGFATLGNAHLCRFIGGIHQAARGTWYQKWNVHRIVRPEVFSGRVHNVMIGARDYPIHPALFNSSALPLIYEHNRAQNDERFGVDEGTYLLPQLYPVGSPTHPSFPAGHAILVGATVTLLKAWFNESEVFPSPVEATADGYAVVPYGGPPLTIGGELNKLAHNLACGRDMAGVHWRVDGLAGLLQGEEIAIRTLKNDKITLPEPYVNYSLTRFDGTPITI